MAKAGSYEKISVRQDKFKSLSANGGKGAGRGASGTKRNTTKSSGSKIEGTVKY